MKSYHLIFAGIILILLLVGSVQAATYLSNYDAYKVLLMHMNGTDGGTTFTDETGKVVTRYGNTNTVTATKYLGSASGYFDGTGDYLSLADSVNWYFTGDYTILFWIKTAGTTRQVVLGQLTFASQTKWVLWTGYTAAGVPAEYIQLGTAAGTSLNTTVAVHDNTWHQVVLTGNGATGAANFYVDGVAKGSSTTMSVLGDATLNLNIGMRDDGYSYPFTGYLDELAIWKGVVIPIAELYPMNQEINSPPPLAMFTQSKAVIRIPNSLTVTDASINTPTSWDWRWGDGTANSTTQNPTHLYTKRGKFTINLIATNAAGSNANTSVVRVIGYDNIY